MDQDTPQIDYASQTGSEDPNYANVQDSSGDFRALPIQQIPDALSTGQFTLADPQAIQEYKTQAKYGSPAQTGISGLESAGRALSFGTSTGLETALGVPGADILGREAANPGASFLGAGLGLGISSLIPGVGEANILRSAGEGVSGALDLGLGAKIATESALLQGGDEISHMLAGDPNQSIETAAANIGLAAVIGGAGGAAFGAVSPLWSAANGEKAKSILESARGDFLGATNSEQVPQISPVLKKALSTFGGVSQENIDAYIANHDSIATSPDYESIYSHVLDHIQGISDDLDNNKITASQATSKYNSLVDDIKTDFRQKGYEAATANIAAKQALSDAQSEILEGIKSDALSKAPSIVSAVENLRKKVIDGSSNAYDVLNEVDGKMSLNGFINRAEEITNQLREKHTPQSLQMANQLENTVNTMISPHEEIIDTGVPSTNKGIFGEPVLGPNITKTIYNAPYPKIKVMIQALDPLSRWSFSANEIDKGLSPLYKNLRSTLDEELKKSIPEYRSAMKPVAEDSSLLNKLDGYGTNEDAVRSISSLKSTAKYTNDMPILRDLENSTGIKFTNELDHYASPALRDLKVKSIPAYADAEKTSSRLQSLKDPETQQALLKMAELSPEYSDSVSAVDQLARSKENAETIRGITENNLQSKLNSVMNNKSIVNRKLFDGIPGMQGITIPQALDLVRVRAAFEKGAMNGSRNVNLMRSIGAGIGGILGGAASGIGGAAIGAGVGNTAGSMLDGYINKSGPEMVQSFLDKYIAKNVKSMEAIGINGKYINPILKSAITNEEQSPEGFKAAIDYAKLAQSGNAAASRATKTLFKGSAEVLPNNIIPKEKDLHNLDKNLQEVNKNPEKLLNVGGHIGHYMPNHASAAGSFSANAVNYLESQRPKPIKTAPLDPMPPLTDAQRSDWARTLSVAQMPLVVMQHIKDGTLLPSDVQTIRTLYPNYYSSLVQKITNEMIDHISKEGKIPYNMRQSLSLFTGTPLDSSLTPQSIQAAQGSFVAQQASQAPQGSVKKGTSKLGEIPNQYRTSEQAAQSRQTEQR